MVPDTSQPDSPTSESPRRLKPGVKRISLALQGGGSHGAFTWGVMHRLMSEPRIYIDGISGTSAGAMNAVVFADGFLKGRRQGAIDALERFWHRVGNGLLTLLSNMFTNLNLTDMETGYKVFRRNIIQNITIEENRFSFEPEITAKIAKTRCSSFRIAWPTAMAL